MTNPFIVGARRASNGDPKLSVTYRTSEFKGYKFVNKKKYLVVLDTGDMILTKATRKATTLYSGKIKNSLTIPVPEVTGEMCPHRVVSVLEVKELN